MTAPDPGLTADHTFQSGGGGDGYTEPFCFGAECSCGEVYESWVQSADDDEGHDFDLDRLADLHAAHVALVVEQHTNGRITELEERIANAQSLCNATGRYNAARQKHWNIRVFACDVLAALKGRAALEGEQQ